jgi:hypothetical protein
LGGSWPTDRFMEALYQALDLVEKEEEEKAKEAQRKLAKEAKLKVKKAFKVAVSAANMKEKAQEARASKKKKKPHGK